MGDGLTLEKLKIDERLREVEKHISAETESRNNLIAVLQALVEKVGKQNGRIGKLENWKAYILGGIGGIGGLFGVTSLIITWIKH